jgi:hypothetical protein
MCVQGLNQAYKRALSIDSKDREKAMLDYNDRVCIEPTYYFRDKHEDKIDRLDANDVLKTDDVFKKVDETIWEKDFIEYVCKVSDHSDILCEYIKTNDKKVLGTGSRFKKLMDELKLLFSEFAFGDWNHTELPQ